MSFLIFLVVLVIAYFTWRIADQLPDGIFRLSEIQRDVAEILRNAITEQIEESEEISVGESKMEPNRNDSP
jgi:hypothetical protein